MRSALGLTGGVHFILDDTDSIVFGNILGEYNQSVFPDFEKFLRTKRNDGAGV